MKRILITTAGAAVAALALALPASAATTLHGPAVPNATIACSSNCFVLYNVGDGISTGQPVTQAVRNGANAGDNQVTGAIVRQRTAVNTAYREDFLLDGPGGGAVGTVDQFVDAGLISPTSYAALNYSHHFAFEAMYAPYGVGSGKCVGVAAPAFNGEVVTTQPCGVSAKTLWIEDPINGSGFCLAPSTACPLINGSDANFSLPEVLTGNNSAAGALKVEQQRFQSGVPEDVQEWFYKLGPAA